MSTFSVVLLVLSGLMIAGVWYVHKHRKSGGSSNHTTIKQ